jgi:aminoglycoside phosphotransferase (APT) family kinase protein
MTWETAPAVGVRLRWEDTPQSVRMEIERHLNSSVIKAVTQSGGFSPGVASRLYLSDGRRVFVKAVSVHQNPDSPSIHRKEAQIAAFLPKSTPAPNLLWTYDDGEWVVLLYEDIEGSQPRMPWIKEELDRVLSAVTALATEFTPAPIAAPTVQETLGQSFQGWRRFLQSKKEASSALKDLDDWAKRNLERLADLESSWETAAAGDTLLHCDIRADNILLTKERVFFVDWPWTSIGAKWLDLLFMLPSVAMQDGPKPWEIFDNHPLSRDVPARAITSVLAALTGLFLCLATKPPPPGLPTLRRFQSAQGASSLEWLKRRTGWS